MSEAGEVQAEVEPDDDLDGCDLDFTENPTSDADIAGLLASAPGPMKAQREEEWEQEEAS